MATRRRRRTAEEAKREILAAADGLIREHGPDALRLQEVAKVVGMSHATVLHHIGSREALLKTVATEALTQVREDLLQVFTNDALDNPRARVAAAFEVMDQLGHPRLLAWLSLTGRVQDGAMVRPDFGPMIDVMHAVRVMKAAEHEAPAPDLADSRFLVMLVSFAMLGQAVAGSVVYDDCGLDDHEAAHLEFRERLIELLAARLED